MASYSLKQKQRAVQMMAAGTHVNIIADKIGANPASIYAWAKKAHTGKNGAPVKSGVPAAGSSPASNKLSNARDARDMLREARIAWGPQVKPGKPYLLCMLALSILEEG